MMARRIGRENENNYADARPNRLVIK